MLEESRGLPAEALDAIADLERRVVAADGGRLKLEWGTLRARPDDEVQDLLWWEGGQLLGFLGSYRFGPWVELAGMVAPEARRRGIGTALVDAGVRLCREPALLVVPRASAGGRALALGRGAVLDHSEHALVLTRAPAPGPTDPRVSLRRALPADADVVSRLLAAGFGYHVDDMADRLADDREPTLLVERDGAPVGTLRVTLDGDAGGVYGFVVDPAHQAQGIGRDVLRRVCTQLRADGATRVGLEVAVQNEHALGLYTSIGFRPRTTEDYYALPAG